MIRCDPCVEAGPDLSELADHYQHRGDDVAVIGINNESIFGVTKPADMDLLSSFLEANREGFRYTVLVDNDEGYAKDSTFVFLRCLRWRCIYFVRPHPHRGPRNNIDQDGGQIVHVHTPFLSMLLHLTMWLSFSLVLSNCLLCLAVYKATAYRGIPCVVLVIDGLVTYVGAPQEQFRLTLDEAIETISLQSVKEP